MDDPRWALAALNSAAFLLCVAFLLYVVAILRPLVRREEVLPGTAAGHEVHFVIPCLDEEGVIGATVEHLVATFPTAQLWCVDDGSTDATGAVLAGLAERHAAVHLVSRRAPHARQGKGAALNAAWRALSASLPEGVDRRRVIVGVLDADARLERTALDVVCGPAMFGDPGVAAVQVKVRITQHVDALAGNDTAAQARAVAAGRPPRDPLLVLLQDLEFVGPIAAVQTLRRRTGSVGMGGNGQFTRLWALDRIAAEHLAPWHGALLEDFELGLHVLLTGGRTEYCDDTFVAQVGLARVRPLLRQRSRWAQGGMQCSRYLWDVLRSPRVPLAGAVEIAHYLYVPWSQLVGSVVFPLAFAVDVGYALSTAGGPDQWWVAGAWGVLPLALAFGVLPHAVWGPLYRMRTGGSISWRRSLVLGLANIGYGYLLQVAVWMALVRLVRRRRDWQKTAHGTTPTVHGTAPAATSAATSAARIPVQRRLPAGAGTPISSSAAHAPRSSLPTTDAGPEGRADA